MAAQLRALSHLLSVAAALGRPTLPACCIGPSPAYPARPAARRCPQLPLPPAPCPLPPAPHPLPPAPRPLPPAPHPLPLAPRPLPLAPRPLPPAPRPLPLAPRPLPPAPHPLAVRSRSARRTHAACLPPARPPAALPWPAALPACGGPDSRHQPMTGVVHQYTLHTRSSCLPTPAARPASPIGS
ncbi:hypothetical protein DFH08DRAFT_973231 [Mycena albidolilacea]|uniref:Uncharacterized protein n=1 Tax=Mycena albidolilacea TaxID=1033008 RepID=A0AAD6ZAB5_9AGAR|nr:hypothetical protein DFH08DRAFT_973231 [Mycena albidolilacea]